jgi:hemolysin activation/secretion protein
MQKNIFLPLVLVTLGSAVLAAPPITGGQLQQIPSVPVPQKAAPGFEINRANTPAIATADGTRIVVRRLTVSGARSYSEADLLTVTGFTPGASLSLSELRAMALKIANFYHDNGYFVALAYLPEQDVKAGSVTIAVVEGNYGHVTLNNRTNVSDSLANSLLDGLAPGDPITSAPLERRLLSLSDLPGVRVSSTLVPGAGAGSSDLLVELAPGQRITGSVDADNAGNRYTGANRVGASVNFNEPLGLGDVASLRAMTSGAGLNYLRGAYQLQLGKARVGLAYSALRYTLGEEFESLRANGTAQVASVYGSVPLIRSRQSNLNVGLTLDAKKYQDNVDSIPSVSNKTAHVLTASLNGDFVDRLGGGGSSVYSLALATGEVDLETPAMRSIDGLTAQTQGRFEKVAFSAARLQSVTDRLSLYASINGQIASKNLDVSEKMELGGMAGVRAYPEGEAYADEGYVLSLEARLALPRFSETMPGQWQLIGFIDTGTVRTARSPWAIGANNRTLSGAGVGLNWSDANNFMVRAYYAVKLGDEAATSAPDASGRFWMQGVKYF